MEYTEKLDYSKRITPENILDLKAGEMFVFGSNESGIHGSGAAERARIFGARIGIGFGPSAATFAIPTKDWNIEILPLHVIKFYVDRFIEFTKVPRYHRWTFVVTRIGCGLAGYKPEQIAPMFAPLIHSRNVHLPQDFWEIILKQDKNK